MWSRGESGTARALEVRGAPERAERDALRVFAAAGVVEGGDAGGDAVVGEARVGVWGARWGRRLCSVSERWTFGYLLFYRKSCLYLSRPSLPFFFSSRACLSLVFQLPVLSTRPEPDAFGDDSVRWKARKYALTRCSRPSCRFQVAEVLGSVLESLIRTEPNGIYPIMLSTVRRWVTRSGR